MRRILMMAAAIALSMAVHAQEVVDETTKNIPPELMQEVIKAFGDILADPSSVQFRGLKTARLPAADYDAVCGEFNAKNKFGGYTGYKRFQFHPPYKSLSFSQTAC